MGQSNCGNACLNTQTDPRNCGTCGNACAAGQYCVRGACGTMPPLYHGWTSPVAGCLTTGYTTTAPTNQGGTYPFNMGDSDACRAWKLAATVCNTMPLPYSGNENFSCVNAGGFTDPAFGTYCAVANQYSCSSCPGACNAGCIYTPLSLRNCTGMETTQL
jgi:Stigma-specific protein, Stig1